MPKRPEKERGKKLLSTRPVNGMPASLFCSVHFKDIEPIYFVLMLNFVLAFVLCGICRTVLLRNWIFGLRQDGILSELKKYGLPALIAAVIVAVSFCIGLFPFDNTPTAWRVLIEGVLYYVGVGIMEELYLRGLLQNIVEKLFGEKKHALLYAILITSVLFGVGHIFGAIGQPLPTILCKAIWATGLDVYLGSVYAKTRNLWVTIILHTVIDFCGIPVCFSTKTGYPDIALTVSLISFDLLGIYGIYILKCKITN